MISAQEPGSAGISRYASGLPARGATMPAAYAASGASLLFVEVFMAAVQGTIKRLVGDKGFGFVAAQDGSEYFFHRSACNGIRFDDLREGQSVTFEKGQGPKGPRAENVTPA